MSEENKKLTAEEKEKLLKKGKQLGIAAAITGLATGGTGLLIDADNGKFKEYLGKNYDSLAKGSKKAKFAGAVLTAGGLGAYGLAKYKHHKLKKNKDDNPKK